MHKTSSTALWLTGVVVVIVASIGILLATTSSPEVAVAPPKPQPIPEQQPTPAKPAPATTAPVLPAGWKTYQSESFSLPFPPKIWAPGHVPAEEQVEFIGHSDFIGHTDKDSTIFVTYKSSLLYPKIIAFPKEGVINVAGIPWAIQLFTAKNDQELSSLITKRYGKDCKLGEKTLVAGHPGLYDVSIGGEFDPEKCFVNYATVIKYEPATGKVAMWDIGQEGNFWLDSSFGASADEEMVKGFSFETR